jgi:hypothetical protein
MSTNVGFFVKGINIYNRHERSMCEIQLIMKPEKVPESCGLKYIYIVILKKFVLLLFYFIVYYS